MSLTIFQHAVAQLVLLAMHLLYADPLKFKVQIKLYRQKKNTNYTNILVDEPSRDPCNPSPCGPNSVCRVVEGHAVCSCQNSMIGSPPSCRPECVVSAECPLTQACLMSKCRDPCPGTCGHLANCKVVNHSPICTCPPQHSGDPFRSCYPIQGNIFIE